MDVLTSSGFAEKTFFVKATTVGWQKAVIQFKIEVCATGVVSQANISTVYNRYGGIANLEDSVEYRAIFDVQSG